MLDNAAVVDRKCTIAGMGDNYGQHRETICAATTATNGEMCQWYPYSYRRYISRYPAEPRVQHPGKKWCKFTFALTEFITCGMHILLSVATTDALHPEKTGFPFYKFRCCGSKRDSPENAPEERRRAGSESWFQKWWNCIKCCRRKREPSTDTSDSDSSESSRSDSELTVI